MSLFGSSGSPVGFASLSGAVLRLSLPVIAANLLQSLVNIVDVFMVGRLGSLEVAAVGLANPVRLLLLVAMLAVTSGSMALAAQAKGARDPERLSEVARQTLTLSVLLSLLLTLAGWLASPLLIGFLNSGGEAQAASMADDFLKILFLGSFFLVANLAISSLMQGAGDTVTPLALAALVNGLNILFNALFIFGLGPLPALGVPGAALGTVAARAVGLAAGLALLASGRNVVTLPAGSFLPRPQLLRDILAIGIPSGLQGLLYSVANLFIIRLVTSTPAGTYGAAAAAIGFQVESLAFMPGLAINVAATSLVGQALGAWQVREARRRGNAALVLGLVIMSAIAAVLFWLAPGLVRLFDREAHPVVMAAGISYLRINALGQPLLALSFILGGALRGAGDTRPALLATLIARWLVGLPCAYLLAFPAGLGLDGIWWALVIGIGVQAGILVPRWRGGAWPRIALARSDLYRRHLHRLPPEQQARFLDEIRTPLLALADSRERIDAEGAEYQLGQGLVRFRFGDDAEPVEGKALLREILGPEKAAAAPSQEARSTRQEAPSEPTP